MSETMKAVVLQEKGRITIDDVPPPWHSRAR